MHTAPMDYGSCGYSKESGAYRVCFEGAATPIAISLKKGGLS